MIPNKEYMAKALSKEQAAKVIDEKLQKALKLIEDCVTTAEHAGVVFHLPWGGEGTSQRGMGASYVPATASEQDKKFHLNDYYSSTGWQPSAGTC
jgi:hypothetical protein